MFHWVKSKGSFWILGLICFFPAQALAGSKVSHVYLNPGLTVGGTGSVEHGARAGTILGGELSVAFTHKKMENPQSPKHLLYTGVVVDGVYDFTRKGMRVMVGPEVGLAFWGLDGVYLMEIGRHKAHHGAAVRLYASLGLLSVYVRYGMLRGTDNFVEAGLLLKIPFGVFRSRRRPRRNVLCFLTRHFCPR